MQRGITGHYEVTSVGAVSKSRHSLRICCCRTHPWNRPMVASNFKAHQPVVRRSESLPLRLISEHLDELGYDL